MEAGQGGRRETTAEGEGQMDGPDTAPPTVMSGTGRPIVLAHRCGHIKALYHSQVEQIGVRPGNLGTSWFGFLSLTIN